MDKGNVAWTHNGIFLSHKKEQNNFIFREMNGTADLCSMLSEGN